MRRLGSALALWMLVVVAPAGATPVCTDGYKGGPPAALCGGRIFPEAALANSYVQYTADPLGFMEYQHGVEYLAQKYPRYVSVFKLSDRYGPQAVSSGPDEIRSTEPGDTGDGRDIWVIKITDHEVPDEGKETLFYSLSVHGNERGGLEGGLRTAEDLAMAATDGGTIADGVDNYTSTTGREPEFHEYEVAELLSKEALYLIDFNLDGWAVGDWWAQPPLPYERGNSMGTDINRQMPSKGSINANRNPLQESEAFFGHKLMHEIADAGRDGRMAYGADIHGELNSQAYVDIMYPAGQFDSVDHRRLMAIAERTKSVIDSTLYAGIIDQIEAADGGNEAQGSFKSAGIPTKPAHWATVWDTLGYTDTGFIGDYIATDLAVTGMDYEIFLNHTVPDKAWTVYLQENHINATRAIIKTSMAYALTQAQEFNEDNFTVDVKGRPGYVVNPDHVTDKDGAGRKPGPKADGKGADGKPVAQRPYDATNMRFFEEEGRLLSTPFAAVDAGDVAAGRKALDALDTLVLADNPLPRDSRGRAVDEADYYANLKAWVEEGGNLVLTDRALLALESLGVVDDGAVDDIKVYQPYANFTDLEHPLAEGLRSNARQLVEAATLGYGIGNSASPMTIVDTAAWEAAGGHTVGTTGDGAGSEDDGTQVSVGELKLGDGVIRILGGALPMPTEQNDHRYGMRDYALTYTGLFILENALKHDAPGLGT
jgi:hypothetical protein